MTSSDRGIVQDESVFAGGKQACKTKNGRRTNTRTCSHFARGPLFRNGTAAVATTTLAAISWRCFSLFSPIFARPRERRVRKKTPKRTKMSVATPSPLRAPASCGFRKNHRPCRFPFKSASHGGSFTSFTTKPYTGWRTRRLRFRSKHQKPSLKMNR